MPYLPHGGFQIYSVTSFTLSLFARFGLGVGGGVTVKKTSSCPPRKHCHFCKDAGKESPHQSLAVRQPLEPIADCRYARITSPVREDYHIPVEYAMLSFVESQPP